MNQEQIDQVVANVKKFKTEIERLRVIETKWTELLPKLEIMRQYLFRVDRKIASLDEGEMARDPVQIVDYTSAFLSVLEFYFPSTEEEELAASELTRLERLGLELSQAGGELKEEVKREFASLKAQVETEIGRLEAEVKRLKQYTDPRLFAAACAVVEDWEHGLLDGLEADMPALAEAVTWWDGLPFDPEKDAEKLPKYEG